MLPIDRRSVTHRQTKYYLLPDKQMASFSVVYRLCSVCRCDLWYLGFADVFGVHGRLTKIKTKTKWLVDVTARELDVLQKIIIFVMESTGVNQVLDIEWKFGGKNLCSHVRVVLS